MASRKPLVIVGGQVQQLQSGDALDVMSSAAPVNTGSGSGTAGIGTLASRSDHKHYFDIAGMTDGSTPDGDDLFAVYRAAPTSAHRKLSWTQILAAIPSGASWTWTAAKTGNYTAATNDAIPCDTSGGAFTVTLPSSPSVGAQVRIVDVGRAFATNNLTVSRNSSNIEGAAADVTLDINGSNFDFVYVSAAVGWAITPRLDPSLGVSMPRGYIDGLILSNNGADANNDIDIAAGKCRDSTDAADLVLAAALTKQLDAAWAVGTNAGGIDTGSKAVSTTYHVWLIKRSDTGVVDALFSTSATAPSLPASYDYKRRIGSIRTNSSGNIVAFVQIGDRFEHTAPVEDLVNVSTGTARTLKTLSVPLGIVVEALIDLYAYNASGTYVYAWNPNNADASPTIGSVHGSAGYYLGMAIRSIPTNTSGQIAIKCGAASTGVYCSTIGWIDRRGKDAA